MTVNDVETLPGRTTIEVGPYGACAIVTGYRHDRSLTLTGAENLTVEQALALSAALAYQASLLTQEAAAEYAVTDALVRQGVRRDVAMKAAHHLVHTDKIGPRPQPDCPDSRCLLRDGHDGKHANLNGATW